MTNGFLLTEKVAKMLQESNVRGLQITVDGPREIHDKRRPVKIPGVSSYDVVMKNIFENGKYFDSISFRANIDKENKDEVFAFWKDIEDKLPACVSKGIDRTSIQMSDVPDSFKPLLLSDSEWSDFVAKHPSYREGNLLNTFLGCGATIDRYVYVVIDAEGNLFRCTNEIGDKDRAVGNVVDGITNWDRYNKYMEFSVDVLPQECQDCDVLGICMGGQCPRAALFPEEFTCPNICVPEKWHLDDFLLYFVLKNSGKIVPVGVDKKIILVRSIVQ